MKALLSRNHKQAMKLTAAILLSLFSCLSFLPGCSRESSGPQEGPVRLVLKLGKIFGETEPLRRLLDQFEKENPGIRVTEETLPSATDEQHQFYVTSLEGRSPDFDVFSMDVIWVPEFARAGWVKELGHLLPKEEGEKFFPGPIEAVQFREGIYAVPWYIDAGLLYYRQDLLGKYGFPPPRTWPELVREARVIIGKEKGIYGFIWQGKQYEGLVCNVLEYFWSNGGRVLERGRVVIDSPKNIEALAFMRDLVGKYKVTPPLVSTCVEETARNIFGKGSAVFMRNWPYAWSLLQREGSPVRGKIGISPLPSFPGGRSSPTLGGWQLGLNRYSRHSREAEKLLAFLTSRESQRTLSLTTGYHPTRKSLYRDRELVQRQPFLDALFEIFMHARPRPVTPFYMMLTQVMQPEFSAAILGIKSPEEALRSARKQMEHILGEEG
jgi:multiple sugar transport system substrate-binding protein